LLRPFSAKAARPAASIGLTQVVSTVVAEGSVMASVLAGKESVSPLSCKHHATGFKPPQRWANPRSKHAIHVVRAIGRLMFSGIDLNARRRDITN
jgi:hypothetical protein